MLCGKTLSLHITQTLLAHDETWWWQYHALGASVAVVVGVRPVTDGLPVQTPDSSVSVVVSLGKTLHPPCLLMVVPIVWLPHFCQSDLGQLQLQYILPQSVCEWVDD
ncbi:hypothetical protein ATANTOWER_027097 [Ataeniobius toweri]|uniref:Uncharacterized protein n=1 Tax=Ataeniobius toweri TaxID=208326 RepID=A0ABU7B1J2_9TELE|nr:hypothetical protein [Ataeniobius toweri]